MSVTIGDTIELMEKFAPFHLAEEWDNVGLQVGQRDWPVRRVWVALDPTLEVVTAACRQNIDLLITHHPLIFKPLRSVDLSTPIGSVIKMAISHKLGVFSSHTNLDSAAGGVNEVLAKRIGLKNLTVLGESKEPQACKLVLYTPVEHEPRALDFLLKAKAVKIRRYPSCSIGKYDGDEPGLNTPTNPIVRKTRESDSADEIRIESVVARKDLRHIIEHVREDHLCEPSEVEAYPLLPSQYREGLGRVGEFDEITNIATLAQKIKKALDLKWVKVAGNPELSVKKAAVCTGSGSGLMNHFLSSEAQVYISGDLRYHDAKTIEAADLGLIDIGHFASEHLVVESLVERFQQVFSENRIDVEVEVCGIEEDPFMVI